MGGIPSKHAWPAKAVTQDEVRTVAEILTGAYTTEKAHLLTDATLDSVVRHLLSQNTTDRNRDAAFNALKSRFTTWDEAADAPVEDIHACVRPANHS